MDGVIRKSGKVATAHHASTVDHRRVQKSSTLNRKFVKRPVARPKVGQATAATSRTIQRQGYNWAKYGRLTEDQAWDDRSVGMVRMKDITGSSYFTFRIVSAKSPANSWIYHKDAKPAIDMMGALERSVKPTIDSMISEGIQADNKMYSGN